MQIKTPRQKRRKYSLSPGAERLLAYHFYTSPSNVMIMPGLKAT
jgi:hypothetical protein